MVSHGLIGAGLFFLAGTTYDRTRTLVIEELGGLAVPMPKYFAMLSAISFASLALPGMSGFISELVIFLGFLTSEAYPIGFRLLLTFFEAIGIILTPIYLLSMLRQVYYGSRQNNQLTLSHQRKLVDAGPREIFVVVCLLVPMIGIGVYPKMLTQIYQTRTDQVVQQFQKTTQPTLWQ
jgi:NAD(P)H-quinone oxidoreductase subunit 4